MDDGSRIWIDQCEAAREIDERFGRYKALGYLIGERLVTFVRVADSRPGFAAELPGFVSEVRAMFDQDELRAFLTGLRRVGPLAHMGTEEEVATMRRAGMFPDDPVSSAEDILIIERIKELLLS